LLTSPAIAARLAQRFGKQHTWSASQWETYATCPFRFFMQHVLGLEPLGDLVLETDFARRGSRLHDVLAKFHRDWLILRKERTPGTPDEEAAAFLAHLQQVANDRKFGSGREGIDAALHELDHRQILKWSGRHFEHQSKYEGACRKLGPPMTPTHFEFRFGPDRRGDDVADPDSTDKTFTINIDGEPIKITGQIDRIDIATVEGNTVFNVIDYKSGRSAKFKRDQLATGQQLQLPIYVEAAQALVFKGKATPLQAGYWSMGAGYDAKGALTDKLDDNAPIGGWQNAQTIVHGLIREFIQNIRHGDFPVDSLDDKCTSVCDYRMTCRVAQARSLHKTQQPSL
jgi:ATP-dependent helicase/DNAse subunit B